MKVGITGASNFVNRMFEACGNYQWAREFLKNALEAGAKRVEFGIEWQAVEKGVYRRTIIDNGKGMSKPELLEFFSKLGAGAKTIGGVHDNFGVGAKIASLPWNPEGVVVISYKEGKGSMIWIALDATGGDYHLVEFKQPDQTYECVIEPGFVDDIHWDEIKPEWLDKHGTVIVLLGSKDHPHTVLGNPGAGEGDIKGPSLYLNTRFWDLSDVEVRVTELRSENPEFWPKSIDDRDDARRANNRRVMGARYYLTHVKGEKRGKLGAKGEMLLAADRVKVEWYLWEGERPAIHSYARKHGYIAVRYQGELFELTASKPHFRWFGLIEQAVQNNVTLILEPQHFHAVTGWGVHPDQSRNRLIFSGDGEKGGHLPMADWGLEFSENMPDPIREAIRAARAGGTGGIEDENYRKRLQDKFGSRWTTALLVRRAASQPPSKETPAGPGQGEVEVFLIPEGGGGQGGGGGIGGGSTEKKKPKHQLPEASAGGVEAGSSRPAPVDVPRFRFANKSAFERPWHLALYTDNDPVEGGPTVIINVDSPILEQVVKFHQEQYADVHAEEIAKVVRAVFGEIAACKIAHSQKLAREVSKEELDRDYRSERALTIALMGLMAEEAVIGQRLTRFGRRRVATMPPPAPKRNGTTKIGITIEDDELPF